MESGQRSNWERADAVASGVGSVARGVSWVVVRIYALLLIVAGGAVLFMMNGPTALVGLVIIAYGIYLMFGGSWVVY